MQTKSSGGFIRKTICKFGLAMFGCIETNRSNLTADVKVLAEIYNRILNMIPSSQTSSKYILFFEVFSFFVSDLKCLQKVVSKNVTVKCKQVVAMNTPPPHRRVRPLHQTPPGSEELFDAEGPPPTPYGTPLAEPPPLPHSSRTPRRLKNPPPLTPSTLKSSAYKRNERQSKAKRSLAPALAGDSTASSAVVSKPPAQVVTPADSLQDLYSRQNQAALQLYGRVAKGALKHVVAPVAKGALKHVAAPVARETLKLAARGVAATPQLALTAARPLVRGVAATPQLALTAARPLARGVAATPELALTAARPLVRTVSTLVPQVARTVSTTAQPLVRTVRRGLDAEGREAAERQARVDRADRLLIEDKPPASIIDANEESDMISDPDIARRELAALYERYAPGKLNDPGFLDDLLSKYTGRYDQLLRLVRAKYEPPTTASTAVSAPDERPDEPNATPRKAAVAVTSAQIENPGPLYDSPQHPPPPPTPETPVRATPRSGRTHIEATVSNASFMTALSHSTSAPRTDLLSTNTLLDATHGASNLALRPALTCRAAADLHAEMDLSYRPSDDEK